MKIMVCYGTVLWRCATNTFTAIMKNGSRLLLLLTTVGQHLGPRLEGRQRHLPPLSSSVAILARQPRSVIAWGVVPHKLLATKADLVATHLNT